MSPPHLIPLFLFLSCFQDKACVSSLLPPRWQLIVPPELWGVVRDPRGVQDNCSSLKSFPSMWHSVMWGVCRLLVMNND